MRSIKLSYLVLVTYLLSGIDLGLGFENAGLEPIARTLFMHMIELGSVYNYNRAGGGRGQQEQ